MGYAMDIQTILFVTKFETLWFDALASLLDLREAALEHVVFLNVIEREKVALHRGRGYQKREEIKLREMANIRFIDWAETLFEQGMEVGAYIVVGNLQQQVIRTSEKENVDLIVIGNEKKKRFELFFSPSDVIEILRRSHKPVLVYKYRGNGGSQENKPFQRPLIATCFSNTMRKVFAYLKKLDRIIEEVTIVHVADPGKLQQGSAMAIQKTRLVTRRKLDEACDELTAAGIRATPKVYVGDPVREIEIAARECNATMIVAGTAHKKTIAERFVGGTPRALVEKSAFPTLLVPPDPD